MDAATPKRVSTGEAKKRLAEKEVQSAYKAPRGNQEPDRQALEHERRRLETLLA
jgi:hypothetical protein